MTIERVENMAGGEGHTILKRILGEKELNGKCRLYAEDRKSTRLNSSHRG